MKKNIIVPYIFAVATNAEYRKRGFMGNLLRKVLMDLHACHIPFVYLIPAAKGIYDPYGFRTARRRIEKEYQNQKEESLNQPQLCVLNNPNLDLYIEDLLAYVNYKLAVSQDFYIKRDHQYYRKLLRLLSSEGGRIFLYLEQETIKGYGFTEKMEDTALRECIVDEAYEANFLSAICQFHNQESIEIRGSHLETRIVDVEAMLTLLKAEKEFQLVIRFTDSCISKNEGNWSICFQKSGKEITGYGEPTREVWDLEMDISEFAEFLFGDYQFPVTIPKQIRSKMDLIQKIQKNFINDEV
jgi:predicted acetyltransferase